MISKQLLIVTTAGLLLAAPAAATTTITTTVTETFDGALADATWRLGTLDEILPTGGSPGAYLRNPQLDAAVPTPIFAGPLPSPFLGDYRAAKVLSLGLDVKVFDAGIGVDSQRAISLILGSDMGTPSDFTDDCEAYVVGPKPVPRQGSGWRPYEFRVPSADTTLPAGWTIRGACAGLGNDDAWNAVIQNVTRVTFPFSDPDVFWYFQVWDLGIDSVHITFDTRP